MRRSRNASSFSRSLRPSGRHDAYEVAFDDGQWTCSCHTFESHTVGTCSHIMAMQEILAPMLSSDARYASELQPGLSLDRNSFRSISKTKTAAPPTATLAKSPVSWYILLEFMGTVCWERELLWMRSRHSRTRSSSTPNRIRWSCRPEKPTGTLNTRDAETCCGNGTQERIGVVCLYDCDDEFQRYAPLSRRLCPMRCCGAKSRTSRVTRSEPRWTPACIAGLERRGRAPDNGLGHPASNWSSRGAWSAPRARY